MGLFHKNHAFAGGYIDPALKARLDEAARRAGVTRVRVIAAALEEFLARPDAGEPGLYRKRADERGGEL